ncbi:MAG: carboxylating nicotinate-nucleotide diphosphorylase [Firmicutes bacterium]|nr:carboxylating nicotinate-nucleotide diphosphorylase [Bacillota bacterium]
MHLERFLIEPIVRRALEEDLGYGDITTNSIIDEDAWAEGFFISREKTVVAGQAVVNLTYALLNDEIQITWLEREGEWIEAGTRIGEIRGPVRPILSGERVALNFLQIMSGIATATARLVKEIEGTGAKVTDTRKTTPGLRLLEKYAVSIGGGYNHRFNLSDAVLIKDNHIVAAGSVGAAVARVRRKLGHTVKIEVEAENADEVEEALASGVDIIMLDNMEPHQIKEMVKLIGGRALVEASGGMSETNIRQVAEAGVDFISVGAITHSAPGIDISLEVTGLYESIHFAI